jgi:hypothetical protein
VRLPSNDVKHFLFGAGTELRPGLFPGLNLAAVLPRTGWRKSPFCSRHRFGHESHLAAWPSEPLRVHTCVPEPILVFQKISALFRKLLWQLTDKIHQLIGHLQIAGKNAVDLGSLRCTVARPRIGTMLRRWRCYSNSTGPDGVVRPEDSSASGCIGMRYSLILTGSRLIFPRCILAGLV